MKFMNQHSITLNSYLFFFVLLTFQLDKYLQIISEANSFMFAKFWTCNIYVPVVWHTV